MPASSGVAVEEPQSFQVSTKNIGASLSVHRWPYFTQPSIFPFIFHIYISNYPLDAQPDAEHNTSPTNARRQTLDTRRQMETEGHLGALTGWGPRMCVMCLGMMNSLLPALVVGRLHNPHGGRLGSSVDTAAPHYSYIALYTCQRGLC